MCSVDFELLPVIYQSIYGRYEVLYSGYAHWLMSKFYYQYTAEVLLEVHL